MHGVLNTRLLLFHFGLGRSAHLNNSDTADQFRQPLLQLLAVIVAGRLIDLAANFLHSAFESSTCLPLAFDDGGVVFVDRDLLGLAEIFDLDVLQLDAQVFGDGFAAG